MTSLEFTAVPAVEYYLVVDCASGAEGSFTIDVGCAPLSPGP